MPPARSVHQAVASTSQMERIYSLNALARPAMVQGLAGIHRLPTGMQALIIVLAPLNVVIQVLVLPVVVLFTAITVLAVQVKEGMRVGMLVARAPVPQRAQVMGVAVPPIGTTTVLVQSVKQ